MIVLWPYGAAALVILVYTLGCMFVQRLSRPDVFFSVTVPPGFRRSETGIGIENTYRRHLAIRAVIAVVLSWAAIWAIGRYSTEASWLPVFLGWLGVRIAWQTAFLRARNEVSHHAVEPSSIREARLMPRRAEVSGSTALRLGPFALLAAGGLYFALSGSLSTPRLYVLLAGALVCVLFRLVNSSISRARFVQAEGVGARREQRARRVLTLVSIGSAYVLAWAVVLLAAMLPMQTTSAWTTFTVLIGVPTILLSAVAVVAVCRAGYGGPVAAHESAQGEGTPEAEPAPAAVGDGTRDDCWLLGMYYYNPDDTAIFVERRFGGGWTMNLGRPAIWLGLAVLAAFVVVCKVFWLP